jgi:alpha-D-ribose 1-methylphosphonate 5-phosphate C-P lyase
LLCKALDIADLSAITVLNQSDRYAIATSATSTTNAVRIVFWFHRQAKVNHVTNTGYINTASRYISRHQNLGVTFT